MGACLGKDGVAKRTTPERLNTLASSLVERELALLFFLHYLLVLSRECGNEPGGLLKGVIPSFPAEHQQARACAKEMAVFPLEPAPKRRPNGRWDMPPDLVLLWRSGAGLPSTSGGSGRISDFSLSPLSASQNPGLQINLLLEKKKHIQVDASFFR